MHSRLIHSMLSKRLIGALALSLLLCLGPTTAWALDYQCRSLTAAAQLLTDGSVTVTDQRVLAFNDEDGESESLEPVKWRFPRYSEDSVLEVTKVRFVPVDEDGAVAGKWKRLKPTPFQLEWREEAGPDRSCWSYDRFQRTLYVYLEPSVGAVMVEATYNATDAVHPYDDAAEFRWSIVPGGEPTATENVNAEVVMPMPADATVVPYENVYAWGHGPAGGSVDIGADGVVQYRYPSVSPGAYAEARVLFPVDWLGSLSPEQRQRNEGSLIVDRAVAGERGWVDSGGHQRVLRDGLMIGLLGFCFLCIAVSLGVYGRWGREHTPEFKDSVWRDVPDRAMAPAIAGRLWRWNHVSPNDVVATVADMIERGSLSVSGEDLCFGNAAGQLKDSDQSIDAATLRLLDTLAQGGQVLSSETLQRFAKKEPVAFLQAVDRWQQALTQRVAPYHFFDEKSRKAQRALLVLAAVLAVVAVAGGFLGGWAAAAFPAASACAVGLIANYTQRRTPYGNEGAAHEKALRNWIRAKGWRHEPADAELEELLPYAFLFGVIDDLEGASPSLDAAIARTKRLSHDFNEAVKAASRRGEVAPTDQS